MNIGEPQRFIPLEGCFNFRDLGGYQAQDNRTVKYRTLFRADNPQFLTEADAAYVASDLGVAVVIDLRNPEDALESARWPQPSSPVRSANVPVLEGWDMTMDHNQFGSSHRRGPDGGCPIIQQPCDVPLHRG